MKKISPYLFIVLTVGVFFWQFFLKGLLPIPADTIIGLYHPFRDLYAKDYPNGIPFKNFLITDPIRQQYPWRELAISAEKIFELPIWNPYSFSGAPLLANFQSASFYPLNILFFLISFDIGWNLIIFLGPVLGGIFLYLYLNSLKLSNWASLLGAIVFSFSGFSISWLEWGTLTHVGLWLPLMLLSIDKLILDKKSFKWTLIYLFSSISSFFAGHLQIFFYLGAFSFAYFISRWWQSGKKRNILVLYIILNAIILILTSVQWLPTFQFLGLAARDIDSLNSNNLGWFIPWQHLIQFIVPDYFGNPTTLNYWGTWNYGELVGYVGVIPLILAIFAILYRRDKRTLFFGTILFLSLIFSLPTIIARLPYLINIPFLNTVQPTRLMFIIDFSLSILSGLGFDYFLKTKKKNTIIFPTSFIIIVLAILWFSIPREHLSIIRSNLILPALLIMSSVFIFITLVLDRKNKFTTIICFTIIIVVSFDLIRFGWKFTPFVNGNYLFPATQVISFLQKQPGQFRIATTDSRILPPNFSTIYRIQSIDGYDSFYLERYGELITAMERGNPNINPPFGFNRIINPHNYESRIMDLLGVKYVLSLSELNSSKLTKVFQEGQTVIYENKNVIPRAFFVKNLKLASNKNEAIKILLDKSINLTQTGIVENENLPSDWSVGTVIVDQYSENKITISTKNEAPGFLILTDTFYPTWRTSIDGRPAKIFLTNYNFRGVVVPAGNHKIEYYNSLF